MSNFEKADIIIVELVKMRILFILCLVMLLCNRGYTFDTYISPEISRAFGKQQQKLTDSKGNTILITPNYSSYKERNEYVSEKVVAIYDKKAPEGAYGARYVLYTPIGSYVGHHKIMQPSPNGYGYNPIWDGGVGSDTPCFRTIQEAKHYYYPQLY